ncbi:low molecular weight protein-tyrosine-phosphatase [Dietzia cinnamea]|uniref:protein-tyrosine-phosphatase n=1 Tax=Dietzia cinnamea TaxID=321318 RepID=A0ABV3YJQ0_9ACTN|nr:low molecular weight protein-tyrosine-phosphatase [Dietzia cinnamea]MCT2119653.1 low molecular weight phosphotyrosine protein phosphatase [Dietzia cinnamea]MCT2144893.1 low molecular weight phosphotyrosine protein phosphatase [Dietzia cinnamea]MCT2304659.1 low molecular weight phosphotyrosine protein phosphatase [Dietzia cinnamea]
MAGDRTVRVVFVCTGNICRSPMAEVMARHEFEQAGLGDRVRISSVGTGDWHVGHGMDPRAASELAAHGYDTAHVAAQLSDDDHDADLLVALDSGHRDHLVRAGVDPDRVRLLRAYEPGADGADVVDPYYGDDSGFTRTRRQISRALPGLVAEVRGLLG